MVFYNWVVLLVHEDKTQSSPSHRLLYLYYFPGSCRVAFESCHKNLQRICHQVGGIRWHLSVLPSVSPAAYMYYCPLAAPFMSRKANSPYFKWKLILCIAYIYRILSSSLAIIKAGQVLSGMEVQPPLLRALETKCGE